MCPSAWRPRLQERFPGLKIAGTWSPPFGEPTPGEEQATIERINAANSGYRLGRTEHAETGTLDGQARRAAVVRRC